MKLHYFFFLGLFILHSCGENTTRSKKKPEEKTLITDSISPNPSNISEGEIQKENFLRARLSQYQSAIPVLQQELDSSGNYIMGKDSPQKFRRILELDDDIKGMQQNISLIQAELKDPISRINKSELSPLQQMQELVVDFDNLNLENLQFICDREYMVNEDAMEFCWLKLDLSAHRKKWKTIFKNPRLEQGESDLNNSVILVFPDSISTENLQFHFAKHNQSWYLTKILDE